MSSTNTDGSLSLSSQGTSTSTIILDTGTHSIKAGYSSNLTPQVIIPPYFHDDLKGQDVNKYLKRHAGDVSGVKFECPLNDNGCVTSWDKMTDLWKYTLQHDMKITDFADKNILLTEPVMAPKPHREKMIKFAFENLGVKNCHVANQAVMDIYAAGRISGVLMDVGHKSTKFVPILEGFALQYASDRLSIAARNVTLHLQDALRQKYPQKAALLNEYTVERIKEELAYTYCSTWHQGPQAQKSYQLPDSSTIELDDTLRKSSMEVLFSPNTVNPQQYDTYGICAHLTRVIGSCEFSIRKDLFANVVLSGGGSMVPTFKDRVRQEVDEFAPAATLVGVIAPRERIYGSFVGGSILTTLSTFPNLWFTKQEYEDWGPSGVWRKSFS